MSHSLYKILRNYRLAVIVAVASTLAVFAANAVPSLILRDANVKNVAGGPAVFGEAVPIIGGVYVGDSVRILENFSALKLEREEPNVTAYFEHADIFGKGQPVTDKAISERAVEFIGKRFKLVASKGDATFLIAVRVVPGYMDYAIRNRQGAVSNAQVTVLICRLPPGGMSAINQASDCRNTDYKFFGQEPMLKKLQTALDLWWKAVAPDTPSIN